MTDQSSNVVKPVVAPDGMVTADGVPIGKLVQTATGPALQVCDKDKRRADERGTRLVLVDLEPLTKK